MKKRANIATLLAVIALFLILNRAAYKGFFQDDELDNIVTTRELTPQDWTRVPGKSALFRNQLPARWPRLFSLDRSTIRT